MGFDCKPIAVARIPQDTVMIARSFQRARSAERGSWSIVRLSGACVGGWLDAVVLSELAGFTSLPGK